MSILHHPYCDCFECMQKFKINQLRHELQINIHKYTSRYLEADPRILNNENIERSRLFDRINEELDKYLEKVTNPELRPKSE